MNKFVTMTSAVGAPETARAATAWGVSGLLAGTALATLLVLNPLGGTALAQTGGIITACILKMTVDGKGDMRWVSDPRLCTDKETAVSWNIKGPTGARGPQGPAGPAGPSGAGGTPAFELRLTSALAQTDVIGGSPRVLCITEFGTASRFATSRDIQGIPIAGGVSGKGWIASSPVAAAPVPDVDILGIFDRPYLDASGLIGGTGRLSCRLGSYGTPPSPNFPGEGLTFFQEDAPGVGGLGTSGFLWMPCFDDLPAWCAVPVTP